MEAIILCGGKGRRLRPITDDIPKPLVEVQGKTLLDHQMTWLRREGVDRIVLAAGYMQEKIRDHMQSNYEEELYDIVVEDEPLGQAGAMRYAMNAVREDEVVICNVDDLTDVDLAAVEAQGANTLCVAHPRCPFGIVELAGEQVKEFDWKPLLTDYWVDIGVYYLSTALQSEIPEKGDVDVFLPDIELKAYRHTGYWHTVNTKKQLDKAQNADLTTV